MSQQNRQSELPNVSIAKWGRRGAARNTVLSPAKRELDTFLRDSKFFFTRYHGGTVNIILSMANWAKITPFLGGY